MRLIFSMIVLFLTLQPAVASAICHVPTDPYPTIQSALDDSICTEVQIAGGTYYENLYATQDVELVGLGSEETIIDGLGLERVFDGDGYNVTLRGLKIMHGWENSWGGGISNSGGDLTLIDVHVENSSSNRGPGGLYLRGANSLVIQDSVFVENVSADDGGAIDASATYIEIRDTVFYRNEASQYGAVLLSADDVELENVVIADNTAVNEDVGGIKIGADTVFVKGLVVENNISMQGSAGGLYISADIFEGEDIKVAGNQSAGKGGGIYINESEVILSGSTISGNGNSSAVVGDDVGGGLYIVASHLETYDVTISDNEAVNGGGIYGDDYSHIYLFTTTINGNRADIGGGIYIVDKTDAEIENSTISRNVADTDGGGMAADSSGSGFILQQSTVAFNKTIGPSTSGGVYLSGSASMSSRATIWENYGNCYISSGSINEGGYNLDHDDTCGFTYPTSIVLQSAELRPLSDNGGETQTHLPRLSSPVIDAGGHSDCPDEDQRGEARPVDGGSGSAICDIGAVEVQ